MLANLLPSQPASQSSINPRASCVNLGGDLAKRPKRWPLIRLQEFSVSVVISCNLIVEITEVTITRLICAVRGPR